MNDQRRLVREPGNSCPLVSGDWFDGISEYNVVHLFPDALVS